MGKNIFLDGFTDRYAAIVSCGIAADCQIKINLEYTVQYENLKRKVEYQKRLARRDKYTDNQST